MSRRPVLHSASSDLPVLMAPRGLPHRAPVHERFTGLPMVRLEARHGLGLLLLFLVASGVAQAQVPPENPSIIASVIRWAPLLLSGFVFNLAISFIAMAGGTIVGAFLGIAQISLLPPVRKGSWFATQFFRNAPWLVLLFFVMRNNFV